MITFPDTNALIKECKLLRIELDSIVTKIDYLRTHGLIRFEMDTAYVKARETRHWLGECLALLGNDTKYNSPEAVDPNSTYVAPREHVS